MNEEWALTTKVVTETQEVKVWSVDYSVSPFPSASELQSRYQNQTTSRESSTYSFHYFSLAPILFSVDYPEPEKGEITVNEITTTNPETCEPCDPMGGVWMLSPDDWTSQVLSTEPGGNGSANYRFRIMWRKTSGPGADSFESDLVSESLPLPLKKEIILKTKISDGYSSCLCIPYDGA